MAEGISTIINKVEYSQGIADAPNRYIRFVQHWRTEAIEAHVFVAGTNQLLSIVTANKIIIEMESMTEKTNRMALEFWQHPDLPAPNAKPDCPLSMFDNLQQKQIVQAIAPNMRRVSVMSDLNGSDIYETIKKIRIENIG